jgi:hypothetical protein
VTSIVRSSSVVAFSVHLGGRVQCPTRLIDITFCRPTFWGPTYLVRPLFATALTPAVPGQGNV